MNRESSIPTLDDLTSTLCPLGPPGEAVAFTAPKGVGEIIGLLKNDSVAVSYAIIPGGTSGKLHFHEQEAEWIIVTSGVLVFHGKYGEKRLVSGDYMYVRAGEPHSLRAEEGDVEVIAVTIPPSGEYPDGP